MDFWVVAAATGAGYVAKHWQTFASEKDSPSKVSSPRVQLDACQIPLTNLARICLPNKKNCLDHDERAFGLDPIKKQVFQENSDEINRKHELRTKNTNHKSFSSVRPLVVTSNGRDSGRKQTMQINDVEDHNKIVSIEQNKAVYEPIGSATLPRRPKQTYSQGDDMVPLLLGITIGILSTTMANQREIEHLNELLEQAEDMVRDLQNELETKDTFTSGPKADNLELTSDIEAELEAELEILEENMKGYTLQVGSDYKRAMARRDVDQDALTWQLDTQSGLDHCDKSYEPVLTPNYAVSSLDLHLRLHEVIELELRARVKELETVLKSQNNQIKPHSPEPQEPNSFWDFDHTRIESSSSTP